MGESSKIEWTDHTFNPWWGCARVSPGCERCYAESFAKRTGHGVWGVQAPRRFFGDKHWDEPRKWDLAAAAHCTRARVFCASMADVFESRADLVPHRARLFDLIDETPSLDWLLLTKRPQNVMRLVPDDWRDGFPENVWMGTTAEDQERADERTKALLECPAVVRFLSVEPQLELIALSLHGINWVICGGESGPGAREFHDVWGRSIVEQCKAAGVAVFFKQMGARVIQGGELRRKKDPKGGDIREFPHDLRVRQFPAVAP